MQDALLASFAESIGEGTKKIPYPSSSYEKTSKKLAVLSYDHWRIWHERWVSDPGLKEDMSDYYLMEELKEKRNN